jgi:hypothetical protein
MEHAIRSSPCDELLQKEQNSTVAWHGGGITPSYALQEALRPPKKKGTTLLPSISYWYIRIAVPPVPQQPITRPSSAYERTQERKCVSCRVL